MHDKKINTHAYVENLLQKKKIIGEGGRFHYIKKRNTKYFQ